MRPPGSRPRAALWQRVLAIAVAALLAVGSLPLWAGILVASVAIGVILARPVLAAGRRGRARSPDPGEVATALGADRDGTPVALTDAQLGAHTVIVGASGSGKSTTLLRILSDQIRSGKAVVAIDLKGSPAFASQLARAAEEAGRPFRLWTPDGPTRWNPLAYGNATELKDKLISTEWFSEIHYQRAAERYLQTALQVLRAARGPERPPTLDDVVWAMEPSRLEGLLRAVPSDLANRVHDYLGELTVDQLSGISGFRTRLAIITESDTGRYLGAPQASADHVDLRAALRGEQVVVFSLNSSSYGKLAAQLGALAIQDLITAAGERMSDPTLRHPAYVAIDEFSALDRGERVLGLNQRCREAGIGSLVSAQEPTDFERAARGLLNQIGGSTAVKVIHRLDVPSSAEWAAQLSGTETVWEQSHQIEHHPLFGDRDTGRAVARPVERYRVHPNVIKSLPTGHAVVITKVPDSRVSIVDIRPPFYGQPQGHASAAGLPRALPPATSPTRSQREAGGRVGRTEPASRRRSPQPPRLPASGRDGPELS